MIKNPQKRSIDTIFVMIIFGTFAFSVLMVLMLGAGVYRNINDITHEFDNEYTALSYIRTKARNLDNAGAFEVVQINNMSALCIRENIGDTEYQTIIYEYDGWLCEVFYEASVGFTLQDGMRITPVEELGFIKQRSGAVVVNMKDMFILLSPRSGLSVEYGRDGGNNR